MKPIDDMIARKKKQRDKLMAQVRQIDLEIEGMERARQQIHGLGLATDAARVAAK